MDLEASELRVESCGLSLQYYTCLYLLVVLVLLNTCYILLTLWAEVLIYISCVLVGHEGPKLLQTDAQGQINTSALCVFVYFEATQQDYYDPQYLILLHGYCTGTYTEEVVLIL